MKALAILLALASPVAAQDSVDWNGTGCTIRTVSGRAHIAEITCHNRLTAGVTHNRGAVMLDGQPVQINATMEPGAKPDRFEAIPPIGFYADPPADVAEGDSAVIRIWAALVG